MAEKLDNLEERIRHCLAKYPLSRNSDIKLLLYIIFEYRPEMMIKSKEKYPDGREKWWVETEALYLFRGDSITRIRAMIQNDEGLYLPDDPDVRRQRRIGEEAWESYLAKNKA